MLGNFSCFNIDIAIISSLFVYVQVKMSKIQENEHIQDCHKRDAMKWGVMKDPPPSLNKRVVRILLECILLY